jgi:hypothetical protein
VRRGYAADLLALDFKKRRKGLAMMLQWLRRREEARRLAQADAEALIRFPQRSRQHRRHPTRSRSPPAPLITLFDSGAIGMADPVVEAVASASPAKPRASAIFDMRKTPLRESAILDRAPARHS